MLRVVTVAVGVCLGASSVARADTPAAQTRAPLDAPKDIEFVALVEKAERARAAGRNVEAAMAYEAALNKRPDPVISGRYGLVLMKLGHAASAAQALHAAFERGQAAAAQERREVAAAYDKAKALTTWVNVDVSQMGATITHNGAAVGRDGASSFWMFVMPGEHTLRATLDGYDETAETFTAKAGEEITVTLRLLPNPKINPLDQSERTLETLLHKKRRFPPQLSGSNVAGDPDYEPREDPSYGEPKVPKPEKKKTGPRFSVSGGVVTVFGVASWNPAVGGVVGVGLRPHENISFGLEGRAAWLTTGVGGGQISAMTAGGILAACGHLKWFFGCGLGHVGTISGAFSKKSYEGKTYSFVKVGVGGRIGAEIHVGSSFVVRPSVDIVGLSTGTKLVAGSKVVADQPALLIAGQLLGGWEF